MIIKKNISQIEKENYSQTSSTRDHGRRVWSAYPRISGARNLRSPRAVLYRLKDLTQRSLIFSPLWEIKFLHQRSSSLSDALSFFRYCNALIFRSRIVNISLNTECDATMRWTPWSRCTHFLTVAEIRRVFLLPTQVNPH